MIAASVPSQEVPTYWPALADPSLPVPQLWCQFLERNLFVYVYIFQRVYAMSASSKSICLLSVYLSVLSMYHLLLDLFSGEPLTYIRSL